MSEELLSGVVGGLVGGGLALVGVALAAHLQEAAAERVRNAERAYLTRGLVGALEAELAVLWEQYVTRVGAFLSALPDGHIFAFVWPVHHDYFTVYTASAGLLGNIRDDDARTLIVRAYTAAKGMVDSLRLNSEMVTQREQLLQAPGPHDLAAFARIAELERVLVEYAGSMKLQHDLLEDLVGRTLPALSAIRLKPLRSSLTGRRG